MGGLPEADPRAPLPIGGFAYLLGYPGKEKRSRLPTALCFDSSPARLIPVPETPNYIAIFFSAYSYRALWRFASVFSFFRITRFFFILGILRQTS